MPRLLRGGEGRVGLFCERSFKIRLTPLQNPLEYKLMIYFRASSCSRIIPKKQAKRDLLQQQLKYTVLTQKLLTHARDPPTLLASSIATPSSERCGNTSFPSQLCAPSMDTSLAEAVQYIGYLQL